MQALHQCIRRFRRLARERARRFHAHGYALRDFVQRALQVLETPAVARAVDAAAHEHDLPNVAGCHEFSGQLLGFLEDGVARLRETQKERGRSHAQRFELPDSQTHATEESRHRLAIAVRNDSIAGTQIPVPQQPAGPARALRDHDQTTRWPIGLERPHEDATCWKRAGELLCGACERALKPCAIFALRDRHAAEACVPQERMLLFASH